MSCPHGLRSQPSMCSQCLGAVPRQVTHADGMLLVDGIPERPFDADNERAKYYARRGGLKHGRRRQE